jgi:two-component sensor histidine kinase
MTGTAESLALLRELNHRVKNNFQIVASLINLKKRVAEPGAREEIRFIEEHVTAMAVAYRLVYATGSMVEVAAAELLPELVSALRGIAGLPADHVVMEGPVLEGSIGLDQAIAFGLYLAVSLPPYLDHALETGGRVIVTTQTETDGRSISIRGDWGRDVAFDFLRQRLMAAYVRQLAARTDQDAATGGISLRMPASAPDAPAPA